MGRKIATIEDALDLADELFNSLEKKDYSKQEFQANNGIYHFTFFDNIFTFYLPGLNDKKVKKFIDPTNRVLSISKIEDFGDEKEAGETTIFKIEIPERFDLTPQNITFKDGVLSFTLDKKIKNKDIIVF